MSFLSDVFSGRYYNPVRQLPNQGGTYSPTTGTQPAPLVTTPPPVQQPIVTPPPTSTFQGSNPPAVQTPPTQQKRDPDINPVTGRFYTKEEYANAVATSLPVNKQKTGDVGTYAGDQLTKPNQTTEEMTTSARTLRNASNDISVGETDPYDITKGGTIVYSPQEREAIQEAYAGVYNPVLQDVFTKIDAQNKKEALAASQDFEMQKLAKQHEYTMAEKGAGPGGYGSGTYTPGENPTVDSWVERIANGTAKITEIPASQASLRNAVSIGLTTLGNSAEGKPTTTELGKQTLDAAKKLKKMFMYQLKYSTINYHKRSMNLTSKPVNNYLMNGKI